MSAPVKHSWRIPIAYQHDTIQDGLATTTPPPVVACSGLYGVSGKITRLLNYLSSCGLLVLNLPSVLSLIRIGANLYLYHVNILHIRGTEPTLLC